NGTGVVISAFTPPGQHAFAGIAVGTIRAVLSAWPQIQPPAPMPSPRDEPEPPAPQDPEVVELPVSLSASATEASGLDPLLAAAVFATGMYRNSWAETEERRRAARSPLH